MPQAVLERVPVLGHVTGQGLGTDGKVYARPLKYREKEKEESLSLTFHLVFASFLFD